jgi:hypothetical protein
MQSLARKLSSSLAIWILVLLCLISFSLMLWAARSDSAIDDELAHIPAGYGYVHNLDYRLNPEHPPLVKALAMLPVLFLNPAFPTNTAAWTTAVNAQWDMGREFLYGSGNDANAIIQWARIMPILLTILTIIFVFLLARSLMGSWWALLPTALFALSPTVLAHGHYVTTDIGATFGVVFATYFFLRFLDKSSTKRLFAAGLAFGVAQIAKFSTPFLVPLFLFVVFVLWLQNVITQWNSIGHGRRFKTFFTRGWRYLWNVILIFAIGYAIIVYPIYFLFTAHYPIAKQVSDTQEILTSFAGGPSTSIGTGSLPLACHGMRCLADFDVWAARNPILRPFAEYMLGILMVLQRSDAGNTIYFMGHVVNSGGWTYFPTLYLLKEPIPALIIVFAAFFGAVWAIIKSFWRRTTRLGRRILDYLGVNFTEFSMASFIVLYWGYSMRSPLNIGIRHILPTLPFIYILSAGVWKKWMVRFAIPLGVTSFDMLAIAIKSFARVTLKYVLLVALVLWLFVETLFAAPYFLSYFNEFGGGTWNGYRYVTDSNYDWGQDLLRLQAWVDAHPEADNIAVDYFGGGNPKYYLGGLSASLGAGKEVDWSSSKGNPANQNVHWFAVSVNQLQGGIEPLAGGQTRNSQDEYSWLTALRPPKPGFGNVPPPDYRVGTTIFIYHL